MKKKKDTMWTLQEQQIVWHDMQKGIPPRETAKKLKEAGFDREPKDIYGCKDRLKRCGKVKCTYRPPVKKKKRVTPQVIALQPGYDFQRFIQLPSVVKAAFFPF